MRTHRGRVASLALVGLLLAGACAADRRHAARPDDDEDSAMLSADRLDDLDDEGAMADLLEPEEREAMERVGLPADARPGADKQGDDDTAGKVGVSVLAVALSLGAVVAPFFLF